MFRLVRNKWNKLNWNTVKTTQTWSVTHCVNAMGHKERSNVSMTWQNQKSFIFYYRINTVTLCTSDLLRWRLWATCSPEATPEKQRKTCCASLHKFLKTFNASFFVALQHSAHNTAHCCECGSSSDSSCSPVILKEYNVWRHHIKKNQTFETNFPERSQETAAKVWSLITSHNQSCIIFMHFVMCQCQMWWNLKGKQWINTTHFSLHPFVFALKFVITCCSPATENAWPSQMSLF